MSAPIRTGDQREGTAIKRAKPLNFEGFALFLEVGTK